MQPMPAGSRIGASRSALSKVPDMILDLLLTWFWYVMAFAAGMFVAWLLAVRFVPARSAEEALEAAEAKAERDGVDEERGGARTQAHARELKETND